MNGMEKNTAIIKKDTAENWSKAKNYIPTVGVIIIIDNIDGTATVKFGDGKHIIDELPSFVENKKYMNNKSSSGDEAKYNMADESISL